MVEPNRQVADASERDAVAPCRRFVGGGHPRKPSSEPGNGDLRFEAGERRSQAIVGPAAKGLVFVGARPMEVDLIGCRPPLPQIAVRRAKAEKHDAAGGISVSPTTKLSAAIRRMNWSGESNRNNSSMALASLLGSVRRRSSCFGDSNRWVMLFPMRFNVVS